MNKKGSTGWTIVIPLVSALLLTALSAPRFAGHSLIANRLVAIADSSRLDTPTGSGENFGEDEDIDTAFNDGIVVREKMTDKSQKMYDLQGMQVKSVRRGGVYIIKGKTKVRLTD